MVIIAVVRFRYTCGSVWQKPKVVSGIYNSIKPNITNSNNHTTIDCDKWYIITNKLQKLVKNWDSEYINPAILDGLQWSFELVFDDDRQLYFKGSNKFPDNWNKFTKYVEHIGE